MGTPQTRVPERGWLSEFVLELSAEAIRRPLRRWEQIYNTVRPHQALGYRTPHQFLRDLARAG